MLNTFRDRHKKLFFYWHKIRITLGRRRASTYFFSLYYCSFNRLESHGHCLLTSKMPRMPSSLLLEIILLPWAIKPMNIHILSFKNLEFCFNKLEIHGYFPTMPKERTQDHQNALWSYPRSGNHWLRFIAEYLTGRSSHGDGDNVYDRPIFMNRFHSKNNPLSHVNGKLPYVVYKSHCPFPLTDQSTIILLIRDFQEHLSRNDRYNRGYHRYLMLIKNYDNFRGTKMLIYYEDLILKPEMEILRIKNFLDASETRYRTFMNHYYDYAELSRTAKHRAWYGNTSQANIKFYQTQIDKKVLIQRLEHFYRCLNTPDYRHLKPYIARYLK